jgi:N-formylglutamate amidohydrolase
MPKSPVNSNDRSAGAQREAEEERGYWKVDGRPGDTSSVREPVAMERLGYEVTVNRHYAGAESVRKHADPANGYHSLQIELNRSLYMNEELFTKGAGFEKLSDHLGQLAQEIAGYSLDRSRKRRVA